MKTTGYNDIDLENLGNYYDIRTDSFWEDEINIYEQLYRRYTKRNDLILNIFGNSKSAEEEAIKLNRLYFEIENYKYDKSLPDVVNSKLEEVGKKNIQLLLLNPDFMDIRTTNKKGFFNTFKQFAKLGIRNLEQGRFVVLIIGDTYSKSTLHLESSKCVQLLIKERLQLRAHIVKQTRKFFPKLSKVDSLWHYRALMKGFHLIDYLNIFIFTKD